MKALRNAGLFVASVVFLAYVLAPIAWLVSSSFQSEAEITSKPPHWIPHHLHAQAPNTARISRCRSSKSALASRLICRPCS